MTVSCTGCTPVCPGTAKRLPTSKSTRILSFLWLGSKFISAMNQGLLMPRAVSKIFSVTIATYPFAVNRNPTAAQDASCHLDEVALMDPQALATLARPLGQAACSRPAVGRLPHCGLPGRPCRLRGT